MNYRMILFLIGQILRMEALFMLPAAAISLFYREYHAAQSFAITVGILLLASLAGGFAHPKQKRFYAREGLVIVSLVWVLVSMFGALPFFISGEIPNYVDALFETVSGFTTTGASILTDVEVMSRGLLYWRSFTHWVGGMGVLVFLLAILPLSRGSGYSMHIMRAESPGPQVGKLVPKIRETATILYGIYLFLSVAQLLLLLAGGMPLFDAVCTMFGTAGTGGFGIKNDSIASYSPYLQWVVTIFMILFGVNFNIFYLLLLRAYSKVLCNEELRAYLSIILGSIALITLDILPRSDGFATALRNSSFQVASIITTTGFSTTDFNLWPQLSKTILALLMIVGASAGSTGGGIKVSRLLLLFKSAKREILTLKNPHTVRVIQMDGERVEDQTMRSVYVYFTLYSLIAMGTVLILSLDDLSMETNLTAMLSCLNNIGPGLDQVGPMSNFSVYSNLSKVTLSFAMLAGRLEIFPILMLFLPSVWKRKRCRNG